VCRCTQHILPGHGGGGGGATSDSEVAEESRPGRRSPRSEVAEEFRPGRLSPRVSLAVAGDDDALVMPAKQRKSSKFNIGR